MVTCLTMTVIGGRRRIAGAIVGAILITYLARKSLESSRTPL